VDLFGFLRRRRGESTPQRDPQEPVGAEWRVPTDVGSIQEAIDRAQNGDTITVEPGQYNECINFSGKNVTLRSTDPTNRSVVAATIINGNQRGCVVTFENGETSGAVLAGLTITNGLAPILSDHPGGGITIINKSAPVIERNVICSNVTELDGGGIYVDNSWPYLHHNRIVDNVAAGAGGGIHVGRDFVPRDQVRVPEPSRESYARFLDSVAPAPPRGIVGMERGDAPGAAAMAGLETGVVYKPEEGEQLRARIEGNAIIGNQAFSGGGLHVSDDAPSIVGNAVRDNRAECGAGMTFWDNSRPLVGRNRITENRARQEGGGIMVEWGASPVIIANQLLNNQSPHGGGICVGENARPLIRGNRFQQERYRGPAASLD